MTCVWPMVMTTASPAWLLIALVLVSQGSKISVKCIARVNTKVQFCGICRSQCMICCMTDWDRIRHKVAGIMSFHLLQGQELIR